MLGVRLDGEAFPCMVQHRGFVDTWELGLGGLLNQGGAVIQYLPDRDTCMKPTADDSSTGRRSTKSLPDHHRSHLREDLNKVPARLEHPVLRRRYWEI